MSYLQKKTIRGHVYYYYTVTKRVDGKSQKIQQVYLGNPDQTGVTAEAETPVKLSSNTGVLTCK